MCKGPEFEPDQIPAFYRNIISYWQELNTIVPKQKEDVLNQIIWNNRFIKIINASVFFRNWHHAGTQHLSSLLSESKNNFLTFNSFQLKYNIKCNFVQYYGLLSAIPRQWKDLLKVFEPQGTQESPLIIKKLTCKVIYNSLIIQKTFRPHPTPPPPPPPQPTKG